MAQIDASMIKKMFLAGAHALNADKDRINELNVFPVPDGDTGTNMTMTILSAAKEVLAVEDETVEDLCKAISSGSLRGARGNSGVILSQLFRGFTRSILQAETIDIPALTNAFVNATETAYKAVMKPKEGTILTVQKGMSECAKTLTDCEDTAEYFRRILESGDETLARTPEMLPVLKQAGVVDSGGQGLMVVLHGMVDAYLGKEVDLSLPVMTESAQEGMTVDTSELETAEITFGYCTEFIVKLPKPLADEEVAEFKAFLTSIGDSIVCVADDDIVKVHVHTNDPGLAIQKGLSYGELSRMKIDNMREEHEERLFKNTQALAKAEKEQAEAAAKAAAEAAPMPHKDTAFIAVASGEGLRQIFTDMGVDYIISGGQTMNPSTEDFLEAFKKVNADHIFVLPNNGNVILAARQAASLVEDQDITVISTRTLCQGIACLVSYVPFDSIETNVEAMDEARKHTKTIEVTYAVRSTEIDGVEIRKDDYMALGDGKILSTGPDIQAVIREAVRKSCDPDSAIVSVYYGEDVAEADAEAVSDLLQEDLPDIEVTAVNGGQPVYYYMISVE